MFEVGMADTGSRTKVLVVDDEPSIREIVRGFLEREGMTVVEATDGPSAVEIAREAAPDVVVLDLMLPGFDGLEVLRRIRTFADPYVLLLTARGEEVDRIVGLTVGADDYLTKPFSPRELVARVHALLRRRRASTASRPPTQEEPPRVFGAVRIDVGAREVQLDGEAVALTRTEFDVLEVLSGRPKQDFSRRQLIDAVWDQTWVGDEHLVDVHIG